MFEVVKAKTNFFFWIMYHLSISVLVYAMFIYVTMESETKKSYTDCFRSYVENITDIAVKQTAPSFESATTSVVSKIKAKAAATDVKLPTVFQNFENNDLNMIDVHGDTVETELIWDDFSALHYDEDLYQRYRNQESSTIAAPLAGRLDRKRYNMFRTLH